MFRFPFFYPKPFGNYPQVGTRNGSMFIITNNTNVDFEYYDTPHKKFKKMSKTYVSAMVQVWGGLCYDMRGRAENSGGGEMLRNYMGVCECSCFVSAAKAEKFRNSIYIYIYIGFTPKRENLDVV